MTQKRRRSNAIKPPNDEKEPLRHVFVPLHHR